MCAETTQSARTGGSFPFYCKSRFITKSPCMVPNPCSSQERGLPQEPPNTVVEFTSTSSEV